MAYMEEPRPNTAYRNVDSSLSDDESESLPLYPSRYFQSSSMVSGNSPCPNVEVRKIVARDLDAWAMKISGVIVLAPTKSTCGSGDSLERAINCCSSTLTSLAAWAVVPLWVPNKTNTILSLSPSRSSA